MKNKIILPAFATLISSSLVAIITSSIAWFSNKISVTTEDNLTGSSDGAYFAYGTGTIKDDPQTLIKEGPYGIETPRQLYNLAWLQYLGYFNRDKDEDDVIDQQYYFELNADIDMTGWVLPPIGTTLYPFIGNFNGRNFTITNLKISNNYQEILATNKMPSKVRAYTTKQLRDVNIVGMFGVIGELDDNITATYDANIISVRDFTIAGAEIKNSMSETLAGIAAGYVNGPLKNVAITSRSGDVEHGESATMASRITTTGATNYDDYDEFDNISDYGVVGYCEPSFLDQVKNSVTETYNATSRTYDYIAQTKGEYAGWGGSMNMLDVYNGIKVKHWDDIESSQAKQRSSIQYTNTETYIYNQDGETIKSYSHTETYSPNINGVRYYDRHDDADGYRNTSYSLLIENPEGVSSDESRFMCLTGYGPRVVENGNTITTTTYGESYYIHLGSDYLANNGTTGIRNVTSEVNATKWIIEDGSICTNISNTTYCLNARFNNGSASLSLSNTRETNWSIDNGKISTVIKGVRFYLYCQNQTWFLGTTQNQTYTYSSVVGNGRYLYLDNTTLKTSTSEQGTEWFTNQNNRIYTVNANGTIYYLGANNNNTVGVYTNPSYYFTKNGNYLTYTAQDYWYGTTDYYLYINNNGNLSASYYNATSFTYPQITRTVTRTITVEPILSLENNSDNIKHTYRQIQDSIFYTPDTYIPLKTTLDQNGYRTGITDETNTGYIVSGNEYYSPSDPYGDIRISAYSLSSSLSNAGGANLSTVYTINASGRKNVTSDAANGFKKFDDSKKTMVTDVLKNNGTARTYVYGLHFMPAYIGIKDSNDHIVEVPKAIINGKTYYNYQLPHDCIDFNLKEKGYINFFGGTYYAGSNVAHNNDSFFSLYIINRDPATQSITGLGRIIKIYEDPLDESHSYIYYVQDTATESYYYTLPYKYQNGVKVYLPNATTTDLYTGYSEVFDTGWIEKPKTYDQESNWVNNAAYYFEIPMNDGEFALGSVEGMYGAYLMYLDIGANAKKVYRSEIIEYFKLIDKVYSYPRGVFVCAAGTTNASDQNSYCICLKDSYNGTLIMDRTADEAKYDGSGSSDKESIAYMYPHLILKDNNGGGTAIPKTIDDVTADSTTTTEIKRLTYYDYNMNDSTLNKIVITDVITTNGDTVNKTRTVEKYSKFDIATQTGTADDTLVIYIKQGDESIKVTDPNTISFSTSGNTTKILSFTTTYVNGASITITFRLDVTGTPNSGHTEYTPKGYTYTVTLTRPDGTTEKITAYCYVKYYVNSDGTYTYTFKINDNSITGVSTTPIEITVPAIPQNNPQNP